MKLASTRTAKADSALTILMVLCVFAILGCSPKYEPRVYDAPKVETIVVNPNTKPAGAAAAGNVSRRTPPMMASSSIPIAQKRILGAIIPLGDEAIYLKATDTIDRLQRVTGDFRSLAESLSINVANRSADGLPKGWQLRWRDGDIAAAEINVEIESDKPVQFTVTSLAMPTDPAAWPKYLQDNINRWRGQLTLPALEAVGVESSLLKIERLAGGLKSNAIAYVFDEDGSKVGAVQPSSNSSGQTTRATPNESSFSETVVPPKLSYDKPEHWQLLPEKLFRLASFKLGSTDPDQVTSGEVSVVLAKDSPEANAQMWTQQVVATEDAELIQRIASQAVAGSEVVQAGERLGKMLAIRANENDDSPSISVVIIPTGKDDMCIFVKMITDWKTAQNEKPNLVSFVKSLHWE